MEENNNIDKIFQSAIEGFTMEPSEKSWNSLQSDLAKKRKTMKWKNRFIMFSVSVVLLVTSFTAYKHFSSVNSANPEVKKQATVTTVDKRNISRENIKKMLSSSSNNTSQTAQANNNAVASVSNDHIISSSSAENKSSVQTTSAQTESKASVDVKHETKSDSKTSTTEIKKDDVSKSNVAVNPKQEKSSKSNSAKPKAAPVAVTATGTHVVKSMVPQNQMLVEAENTITNQPAEKSSAKSDVTPTSENVNETSSESGKINSAPESDSKSQAENVSSSSVVTDEQKSSIEKGSQQNAPADKTAISAAITIPVEQKSTIENPVTKDEPLKAETNPENKSSVEPEKPVTASPAQVAAPVSSDSSKSLFKKIASNLSAEVFYSPDYVNNHLTVNSGYNGTGSQNLNDYKNNQTANFSYSTGVQLRYDITSRWSISSGAVYSTFEQTAVYNTIQVVADSVYHEEHGEDHDHHHGHGHDYDHHTDHHYVVHTPCGDIDLDHEPENVSSNVQDGDTLAIKTETNESIHFIYIPLTVRYQFGKSKFTYFVEAGAAINLVHYDAVVVKINDATENNYVDGLKNSNYSLLFGAGVQYNFYKGLSTFIKPSFRYSITPINQNNPVNTYPYYLGIGLGFSIHF